RLGLAALEERRAVDAREHARLDRDVADRLAVAAVDALLLLQHVLADDDVLALLELRLDELLVLEDLLRAEVGLESGHHVVLRGLVALVALLLVLDERGLDDLRVDERRDLSRDVRRERLRLERLLRLADRGAELLDELEDRLRGLVR